MSKIFDGLLNVYAFAWVLITRSAFGMYACVALMALMLGLFVISVSEQLRLAKKARKTPPPAITDPQPPLKNPMKDEDYEAIIANHRQNAEGFENPPPVTAVYQPPEEGALQEENRADGWLHVFVWRAGNWEKSHRISPGGVKSAIRPEKAK